MENVHRKCTEKNFKLQNSAKFWKLLENIVKIVENSENTENSCKIRK